MIEDDTAFDAGAAPESGWQLVARDDHGAALVAALLELEPGTGHTRSEVAEHADVPLRALYVDETLEDLVEAGLLRRVDAYGEEATFALRDGEVLAAARAFDNAVATEVGD